MHDKRVRGMRVAWAGEQGHLCIYLHGLTTARAWWKGKMMRALVEALIPNSKPWEWQYAGGEQVREWWLVRGEASSLPLFSFKCLRQTLYWKWPQCDLHLVRSCALLNITNTAATTDMATAEKPPSPCLFPSSHPHLDIPPPLGGHLVPNQACPLQHSSPSSILSTLLSGGGLHSGTRIQVIRHWLRILARAHSLEPNNGHCAMSSSTRITISSVEPGVTSSSTQI